MLAVIHTTATVTFSARLEVTAVPTSLQPATVRSTAQDFYLTYGMPLKFSFFLSILVSGVGSCRSSGYQGCCSLLYSTCGGSDGLCMCDSSCYIFSDCCSDISELCIGIPGSCIAGGHTSCCTSGDCFGSNSPSCKCDAACRSRGDCCPDIDLSCRKNEILKKVHCYILLITYLTVCSCGHSSPSFNTW